MLRPFLIVFALFILGMLPVAAQATGDHIVPASDLQQAVRATAQARQDNLARLDQFFSSQPARKAFETVKLDSAKVTEALAFLSDEELARFAARADRLQQDVAAGALTNQQITYILIALATAVIILVIVAR
jgi:hypothetical protein